MSCSRRVLGVIGFVLALVALAGCGPATPETIAADNLTGRWELTSDGETESFNLAADGSFVATIDRDGFIATTLSQGPHVSVKGTWQLSDRTITFNLTSSSDPTLDGQSHSYEILALTDRNMDTVDARGNKKTLLRGM